MKISESGLNPAVKVGSDFKKKDKSSIAVVAVLVAAALTISIILTRPAETHQAYTHMKRILLSSENERTSNMTAKPLFFFLGDSITEQAIDPARGGYIPLLQNTVSRSADIVAHGLSGYNTRWVLKYAMPVVEEEITSRSYTPSVVTIWFGTNDAVIMNGSRAEKHVSLESYKKNLDAIVRKFQALLPSADILLVTPPHVDDEARRKHAEEDPGKFKGIADRSHARSGMYARACVETANKIGIPVLDLFTFFSSQPQSERNSLLWDGLHFTPEGHEIVSELILSKMKRVFPAVASALKSWKIIAASDLAVTDPWKLLCGQRCISEMWNCTYDADTLPCCEVDLEFDTPLSDANLVAAGAMAVENRASLS
ncbi:hypothetical protein PF008_g21536 [Phytophthora fragariae]|uniref:SGNH hydrolase-type esterase domain-containing protein n=1 Tax=Phytophthora fragariae TaxID=53985 RepID=A0A6G0QW97_9STRA|nr:hypothetical protein PF008_g21536 [Phytophthora fragariae]